MDCRDGLPPERLPASPRDSRGRDRPENRGVADSFLGLQCPARRGTPALSNAPSASPSPSRNRGYVRFSSHRRPPAQNPQALGAPAQPRSSSVGSLLQEAGPGAGGAPGPDAIRGGCARAQALVELEAVHVRPREGVRAIDVPLVTESTAAKKAAGPRPGAHRFLRWGSSLSSAMSPWCCRKRTRPSP